ncbi:MAG: alpha/beta hydrolase-fold protein [Opitutaceae bacterium]
MAPTPSSLLRLCALLLLSSAALAQPAAPSAAPAPAAPSAPAGNRTPALVSPEIAADRRVTFRLMAPNATKVSILGQWDNARHDLTKDAQGVWSITLGPIEPSYWIYNFTVDGLDIADPINPDVKLRMRTSASLLSVPSPTSPWDPRVDVPHGSVEINWHSSKVTGDTRAFHVYTPPGYDPAGATRYPVLYLLHGNNGTAADWTAAGRAHFMADNLLAEKRMVPMIIVMPLGHAVPFNNPQGQNNNTAFERYLLEDVLPIVDRKYRVAAGPAKRAILGLSMGGGQAIRIGLGHLDLFSAVGGFSSAAVQDFTTRFQGLLADPAGTNAKLNLLWIGCGRQDTAFGRAEALAKTLGDAKIRHTFFAIDGFHDYFFWRRCFLETAPLLFKPGAKS